MKVTYIVDGFPIISQTFILNEVLELQRQGIGVQVFSLDRSNELVVHPGVAEVRHILYAPKGRLSRLLSAHGYWFLTRPRRYLKALFYAVRHSGGQTAALFLKKIDSVTLIWRTCPDHLHAHFGLRSTSLAMLASMLTGVRYTFTSHGYDVFVTPPDDYPIKARLAKRHITVSHYNRRYLAKRFGIPDERISVIRCGVDFRSPLPRHTPLATPRVISVARLEPVKALDVLVQACAMLKKEGVAFHCLIIGEGTERVALEGLINDLGLQDVVRLVGALPQNRVFELLAESTVKVLSSRSEAMPVALMEAMAIGVPVIGPRVNGVGELVEDGKEGFLVPPGDVACLADRLKRLLLDKELRDTFAQRAYQKVKAQFNLEREVQKLLELWRN
jgi:glycosyltransferase involved in cell wall biosynthesis